VRNTYSGVIHPEALIYASAIRSAVWYSTVRGGERNKDQATKAIRGPESAQRYDPRGGKTKPVYKAGERQKEVSRNGRRRKRAAQAQRISSNRVTGAAAVGGAGDSNPGRGGAAIRTHARKAAWRGRAERRRRTNAVITRCKRNKRTQTTVTVRRPERNQRNAEYYDSVMGQREANGRIRGAVNRADMAARSARKWRAIRGRRR